MITVAKLRRKPHHFHAFTGLSVAEFDRLLADVAPAYEAREQQRHDRPDRKRQPGAGRPGTLAVSERLLLGLVYLRLYVSQSLLAFLFDLDQSNVCRELNDRLLPVLLSVLPVPLRDAPLRHLAQDTDKDALQTPAPKPKRRINTLPELLATYPDLAEVLIDATEQPLPQPTDKHKRKQTYSGKQQEHTVKTQIVATKTQILHVFGGLPGSVHDSTVLGASGVIRAVPAPVAIRLDKGYEGTERRHPDRNVAAPVKKVRGHAVTPVGRAYNYLLSVLRMPVEHHFARLKTFGVMRLLYRGSLSAHEDLFCLVSGLLNYRASGRFTLA